MAVSADCKTIKNDTSNSASVNSSNGKNDCRWLGCKTPGPFSSVDLLVDHVQKHHLSQFNDTDFVACLWQGCKVFNRPFEKKDWLPQHMRRHTNERPHKCFMNGCNMAFWSPHALQTHVQLHFKPSPVKHKKSMQQNKTCDSLAPPLHPSPSVAVLSDAGGLQNGDLIAISDSITPLKAEDSHPFDYKKRLPLKVRIPLNSNVKLSVLENCCQTPVPINGSIIHDDDIDLTTHSIIRNTLLGHLLVPSNSQCGNASSLTDTRRSFISLKGNVIGKRSCGTDWEYLVRWSPMLVPDSWVPISNYTGTKTVALNDLNACQKSALVQCKYLTTNAESNRFNFVNRKRKRV